MATIFVEHTLSAAFLLFVAMVIGIYMERWLDRHVRADWKARNAWRWAKIDAKSQLAWVRAAEFEKCALLNSKEARVFAKIQQTLDQLDVDWRLMAQVNLGEILKPKNRDEKARSAINSKRVDMLIVSKDGEPLHAIEYQGSGHYLGKDASLRDLIKKTALEKAGIGYIEVLEGDSPAALKRALARLTVTASGKVIQPLGFSRKKPPATEGSHPAV